MMFRGRSWAEMFNGIDTVFHFAADPEA